MPHDMTPFLNGLTPDPTAQDDARYFASMFSRPGFIGGKLEDLLLCFTATVQAHQGGHPSPGHAEVLHVLTYAASGLAALLEDGQAGDWEALTLTRMWALAKYTAAARCLEPEQARALHTAFKTGYTLPQWAEGQQRSAEAGRLVAWYAVGYLLEAAPRLDDGEADDAAALLLEAFTAGPWPISRALHLEASLSSLSDTN